jgi:hypothetical protein
MAKQFTTLTVTAAILIVGSLVWKAEAAPVTGVCGLAPLTKSYSPVEQAGCWCGPYKCACRRAYWRRGYWGRGYYWRY